MLTPLEIQQKIFKKTFRGYSEKEVDLFREQVVLGFEQLNRHNRELEERLAECCSNLERYRELENVLKNTLVAAQKSADDLRANTREECRLMLEDARLQAKEALQEANCKAAEIVSQAGEKTRLIISEQQSLVKQSLMFQVKFRTFLEAQLQLLEDRELYGESMLINEAAATVEDVNLANDGEEAANDRPD